MRTMRVLPWLLLAALAVFSAAVYGALPADIPRSVGFDGTVSRAAPKSPLSWALLPIIALLTQGLMEGIRGALPGRPELFNFPGKDDLLKLPREYHPPVIARMQWFMDVVATFTAGIMLAVQIMLWHTARGGNGQTASIVLMLVSVLTMPLVFLLLQGVTNEVEAAKRRWESRRNPLAG